MATEEELFDPLLDPHLDDAAVFTIITAMQQSKHESCQAAELNESATRVDSYTPRGMVNNEVVFHGGANTNEHCHQGDIAHRARSIARTR